MRATLRRTLIVSPLLVFLACDVEVGDCRRDDAGACVDLFPDEERDAAQSIDAGTLPDGSAHAVSDASGQDARAPLSSDAGMDAGSAIDSGAPSDSGAPGRAMTLDEFCRSLNSRGLAWATKLDECCLSVQERGSAEAQAILNLIGGYSPDAVDSCLVFYGGLTADGGTVTYQPQLASSCVADFLQAYPPPSAACPTGGFELEQLRATIGHGAPQLAQLASCRAAVRGKVLSNQPCTRDFECSPGLTCIRLPTGPSAGSTCQPPSNADGFCENNADCAFGYACVGSRSFGRTCRSVGDLVDVGRCETAQECKVGKVCTSGMCAPPVLGDPICE